MNRWIDLYSHRARLARLHKHLSGFLKYVLVGLSVVLIGLGVLFLVQERSLGWFVASLAVWPLMLLLWDEQYLKKIPPNKGTRFDDRIESELLTTLPPQMSRDGLVNALSQTKSAQFMMIRAGLSPQFITDQIADEVLKTAWGYASQLQPDGEVSAAAFLAGLVYAQPQLTSLLAHLQIDQSDIERIVSWHKRLSRLIEEHQKPKYDGGIGRDWSFGYTPLLSRFGVNVSAQVARGNTALLVDVETHERSISTLLQTFSSGGRQNVALVGPSGSGKTTLIQGFAARLMDPRSKLPNSLKYSQVISLDAAALIAAAPGRGELEELVNALLIEAYRAKNIILCLDDAELFFEEGVGSVDISNLLKPILEGGALRIILTMDDQRYLQISQRNPAVAQSLNKSVVEPATFEETLRIMQDQLITTEFQKKVTYMYQAMRESYRLSERYLYDIAQPGKSLRLLVSAAQQAEQGLVTAASVQRAIEQTQGVKVGANVGGDEKEMLLNLEQLIHERMINQTRAVAVVSDALRRARAGVRNESRPIGTFLFLGPTGVGKTELAKSLAAVYFNGEDHMVRLDMNEFVSPDDVRRLIADGADDPNSLSAQVMKQPFSVVLLDELEKAHDTVLATLLQVLDEGVLRDINGREVSFRDTVIIATSNAGAEQIRQHIDKGEELQEFESEFVDDLISSRTFRPEFLNRFDEIVLFRPLKPDELVQIVDLIIAGINKTIENQKIRVEINDELKRWLVVNGNDPRLGARPMRRMVQRVVENTIAKRMLSGEVQPGETISLTMADIPQE